MMNRVMVSPSLFSLSAALSEASGVPRIEWQERLSDLLRDADGSAEWLSWWTAPDGKRHFRIGPAVGGDLPPVGCVYPEACFWRRRKEREWMMACPCGAVVPIEQWRGTHCDASIPEWPVSPFSVNRAGNRLIVHRGGDLLLDRKEGDPLVVVRLADDGQRLAAATRSEVLLWEMDEGELRLAHVLPAADVKSLAFSSDGMLALIRKWDAACFEGRPLRWFSSLGWVHEPGAAGFSPDGRLFVVAGERVYRCERDRVEASISVPALNRAWLSPDARWLAWAGDGKGVGLLDLAEGRDLGKVGWPGLVDEIAFTERGLLAQHGDETRLVPISVFADETPLVWLGVVPEAPSPAPLPQLSPSSRRVAIAAEPTTDSELPHLLALGTMPEDGERSPRAAAELASLLRTALRIERVTALAVSPNDRLVAWADHEAVHLVRRTGELLMLFPLHRPLIDSVRALAFSSDSKRLAFAGADRPTVFDIETGYRKMAPFLHPQQTVWSLAFSQDAMRLRVVETVGTFWHHVSLWQHGSEAGSRPVPGMVRGWLSPGGVWLAWCDGKPGLTITDLTGEFQIRLEGLEDVHAARFLHGGRIAVAGASGVKVLPWREHLSG